MWLNVDFKNLRNYHLLNKKYYIIYKKLITLYKTIKIREEVTNKTAPSIINFLKLFLFFFSIQLFTTCCHGLVAELLAVVRDDHGKVCTDRPRTQSSRSRWT